jgi:bifunctional ADP-heptose synthase (sugar kinase/adenylyltransferase)
MLLTIKPQAVLITQGNQGMTLFEQVRSPVSIPICGRDDITDVTGAGDTVSSVMGLAMGAGATLYESAQLANCAAGVVVMKMGTATLTPEELMTAVDHEVTKHKRQ